MADQASSSDSRTRDITFILKDLLKVIKVVSMYPEDNPLPQSMRRSFAEKLVTIANDYGDIAIKVEKSTLRYDGETVFEDKSREESLAIVFFATGITDFTFKAGIDVEEVYGLLDVIRKHINSPKRTEDLAAKIWEADLPHFKFGTIEDIALAQYDGEFDADAFLLGDGKEVSGYGQFGTGVSADYQSIFDGRHEQGQVNLDEDSSAQVGGDRPAASGGSGSGGGGGSIFYSGLPGQPGPQVIEGEVSDEPNLRAAEAARAMGFADLPQQPPPSPDTTLILNDELYLSDEEEQQVRELIVKDAEFDMYESTCDLLKEMLHQETDQAGFFETVTICEKVIQEFLQAGHLFEAARMLRYLRGLDLRIQSDKPMWAERLRDACKTAGSRERLSGLTDCLNQHPDLGTEEIKKYLDNFDWEALSGITDLLGACEHQVHRQALCDYLARKGENRIDIVAKGIYDKHWEVVRNTTTVLAKIGNDKALDYLSRLLNHPDPQVRLEMADVLSECSHAKALELLKGLALDSDNSVRAKAVPAILSRRGRPAFEAIADVLNDERFPSLQAEDQQALLNAFAVLGGEEALPFLSSLVTKFILFRNSETTFYRMASFEALCQCRSDKAETLLLKLCSSWRPDLKRQARAALQRRRELTYGEDQ